MRDRLPILISIPHGGKDVPAELRGKTCLDATDIFEDGDALTPEIYDLKEKVHTVITASVARVFVDLNRAPDDRPPENPDGVVKTHTVNGKLIYKDGGSLSDATISLLIKKYHDPLHAKLDRAARKKGVVIAVDCHSMLSRSPKGRCDHGALRPLFCVSNCGGPGGDPDKRHPNITCDPKLVRKMAGCLQRAFNLRASEVKINDPFHGGYITASHGLKPIPWMQIELNRSLYLAAPFFDPATATVDPLRIAGLRECFFKALQEFFKD